MHTIERINLPFEVRNPTPEDTKSSPERFLRNQAIRRGTSYGGSVLTKTGLGLIAYGNQPKNLKRTSPLLSKDTTGKRQARQPNTRAAPLRDNRWGANYEKDYRSKSGTNNPSSRVGIRSRGSVMGGNTLVVAGQLIPILGITYIANDYLDRGQKSDVGRQYQSNLDIIDSTSSGISNSWNSLSAPQQFVVSVGLKALFS